jgi:hypothetical protein
MLRDTSTLDASSGLRRPSRRGRDGSGNWVSGGGSRKAPRASDASSRPNRPQSGEATVVRTAEDSCALTRAGRSMRRGRVVGAGSSLISRLAPAVNRGGRLCERARDWRHVTVTAGATRTKEIVRRGDHRRDPGRSRCRRCARAFRDIAAVEVIAGVVDCRPLARTWALASALLLDAMRGHPSAATGGGSPPEREYALAIDCRVVCVWER